MDPLVSLTEAWQLLLPELALVGAACVLILLAAFRSDRHLAAVVALAGVVFAGWLWWQAGSAAVATASSLFRQNDFTVFIKAVSLAFAGVFVLLSWNQVADRQAAEYHACLLCIMAGVNLVAAANDLVSLFLALELISIPTYVLLYLPKFDLASQEAATKYFLLSVFSSALLLYGFSFLYGSTGSTNLTAIRETLAAAEPGQVPGVLVVALVTVLAGLGFRVTAVPFHFYAPDVYQGAPTVGAALLAFVPKVAGFVALVQLLPNTLLAEGVLGGQATGLLWILALVSMVLGNLLALLQDNLKRLLAYSSIAHAGYMLVGLGVGPAAGSAGGGVAALIFYLVLYGVMTVGAFAVPAYLARSGRPVELVDDLAGLGRSHPVAAGLMAAFLFSLTGLPPTAGFWGKLYLLFAAWETENRLYQLLAVLLVINAAVGGWYYLRVVGVMYLRQPVHPLPRPRETPAFLAALVCGLATVGLFVAPDPLWRAVSRATAAETPALRTQPAPAEVGTPAPPR